MVLLLPGCNPHGTEGPEQEGAGLTATRDKGFYTFTYESTDAHGKPVTLSSALIAWTAGASIETVIIACHITVTNDSGCPSMHAQAPLMNDVMMMAAVPGSSENGPLSHSIIIMPDYEGYGISRDRPHPYLARELTARQVIDGVLEGLRLYSQTPGALPLAQEWKSIALGYSQGGAVAVAVARQLEETGMDERLHFAGTMAGDAPLDLPATLRYYIEDNGDTGGYRTSHRRGKVVMPVTLPLIIQGMLCSQSALDGYDASDYLSKQMLDTGILEQLAGKELSTDDFMKVHYTLCENGLTAADGTIYTPAQMQELFPSHGKSDSWMGSSYYVTADITKMMAPGVCDYLTSSGEGAGAGGGSQGSGATASEALVRMSQVLRENSLTQGWTPTHPIVLAHSHYDTVVPFVNASLFMEAFPNSPIRLNVFSESDHGGAGTTFCRGLAMGTFDRDVNWILGMQ